MPLNEAILPEFDREMTTVRSSLEALPDGKFDWRPQQNSMTLGELAIHLATINYLADAIISHDSFNVRNGATQPVLRSRQEILEVFDQCTATARKIIAAASDEQLMRPWTLLKGSQPIVTLPRLAAIRNFLLNHLVRHRAHLRTYLRLNAGEGVEDRR